VHLSVLVGVSDIARLTGQRNPSVVTNWRSRFPTFPPDRTAGTQPRFDLAEVIGWLGHEGPRGTRAPEIPAATWWEMLARAFAAQSTMTDSGQRTPNADPARAVLAALVLLRHLSPRWAELATAVEEIRDDGDTIRCLLTEAARETEVAEPAAGGLLDGAFDVDARTAVYLGDLVAVLTLQPADASSAGSLLDTALSVNTESRSQPARRTTGGLGELMAALANPSKGAVVFDPACGEASLLLACARAAGGAAELHGQERDRTTRQIAATRLLLAGHDPRHLAEAGYDSLYDDQFPDLRADVVVLDPPLIDDAAPAGRWIDHARTHLKPGGRAVVALSLSALVPVGAARRRPDERLRSHLERLTLAGSLESVVVVPRGQRSDVAGPIVVLVVRSSHDHDERRLSAPVPVIVIRRECNSTDLAAQEIAACLETGPLTNLVSRSSQVLDSKLATTFDELLSHVAEFGQTVEQVVRTATYARVSEENRSTELKRRLDVLSRRYQALEEDHQILKQTARELLQRIDALRTEMGESAHQGLNPELFKLRRSAALKRSGRASP
jgi:hypothetical protein